MREANRSTLASEDQVTSKTALGAVPSKTAWTLWAVLTAIPWLLPTHSAPWPTFYEELLSAISVVPVGVCLLLVQRRWQVDVLALAILVAACIPCLQVAANLFPLPAEAPLISLYMLGFGVTVVVARHAEAVAPGRLIEALLAGLLIAALLSTGLALYQWLGGDALGDFVEPMSGRDRPVANVAQPNNLATLLVWGLIATWWAHLRKRTGATGAILCSGFLLTGITLTQSRAGALQVVLIAAVAFVCRGRLRTARQAFAFAGLVLWWLVCIVALDPLTGALSDLVARPLLNTDSPRERTMLLITVLRAIGEHPWIGYGFYQNVPAHVAVANKYAMHGLIANSHNIVLDFAIWCGLPLGLAITVGLCAWYRQAARRVFTAEQVLLLLALGTFCVHASLELPHVLAYFLVPVAVMMGTLSANLPLKRSIAVPRAAVAGALLLFTVTFVDLFAEYLRIEANLTDVRMRAAHIAGAPAPWDPHARLLGSLQSWVTTLQVAPDRGMTPEELDQLRRFVTRYPTSLGLLRYAEASALNARPGDARWAFGVLCSVHPESECEAAAHDWLILTAKGRPELAAVPLPMARHPLPAQ